MGGYVSVCLDYRHVLIVLEGAWKWVSHIVLVGAEHRRVGIRAVMGQNNKNTTNYCLQVTYVDIAKSVHALSV